MYKGTKKSGTGQILLRSYDSRKEPAAVDNCTIWQAGRATCATALAFKPIQIGQSVFLDEGAGKYNPAPMVLDEAVCNEWPGREVGVFISIGTGKRPEGTNSQQHLWWEGFVSSGVGDFAEARRKLISKIEDCEKIHLKMKDHLAERQVNPENYYRLNVSVGVGEFGMNEWNRLADISTSTRMYLAEPNVQSSNLDAAAKLGRIYRAKQRWERAQNGEAPYAGGGPPMTNPWETRPLPSIPDTNTSFAVELPAEEIPPQFYQQQQSTHHLTPASAHRPSETEKFSIVSSDEYPQPVTPPQRIVGPSRDVSPYRRSGDNISHGSPRLSFEEQVSHQQPAKQSPPPLPPKTPLQKQGLPANPKANMRMPPQGIILPYPDTDGPPPAVNKARKPELGMR